MSLNFQHVIILAILSAVLHWIFTRAEITRPLWSKLPPFLDKLARCPACSGYWIGWALGLAGVSPVDGFSWPASAALTALFAVFLTPVTEAIMLWGLEHSAIEDSGEADDADNATPPPTPPS